MSFLSVAAPSPTPSNSSANGSKRKRPADAPNVVYSQPADMGTAKAARAIEPLCQLWCIPGFRQGKWKHAFKMIE